MANKNIAVEKNNKVKEIIKESFHNMIMTQEYNSITVKDLCIKSGLSRSSFYIYYSSLDELFSEIITDYEAVIFRLIEKELKAPVDEDEDRNRKLIYLFLSTIQKNKDIFKVLYKTKEHNITEKLLEKIYETFFKNAFSYSTLNDEGKYYTRIFYSKGLTGLIGKWIENDLNADTDNMAKFIAIISEIHF